MSSYHPMMTIADSIEEAFYRVQDAVEDFEAIFSDDNGPEIPEKYKSFRDELEAIGDRLSEIIRKHPEISEWLEGEREEESRQADMADALSY